MRNTASRAIKRTSLSIDSRDGVFRLVHRDITHAVTVQAHTRFLGLTILVYAWTTSVCFAVALILL